MAARRRGPEFAAELEHALKGLPPSDWKFVFVGVLNRYLRRSRAVLVGGGAVELYSAGAYRTGDVDLVGDRNEILPLLEGAGFERHDRLFINEALELAIDIAGTTLRPTEIVEAHTLRGYQVPVVSVEDVIVDRLLAAKYWRSDTDWEQAKIVLGAHFDTVDRKALEDRARKNEVEDKLQDLFAAVNAARRSQGERE